MSSRTFVGQPWAASTTRVCDGQRRGLQTGSCKLRSQRLAIFETADESFTAEAIAGSDSAFVGVLGPALPESSPRDYPTSFEDPAGAAL